MSLAGLSFQQEQRLMITRIQTWMSKHYQNYLADDGAINADALADDAAWNFGILRDWARELAEEFKAGKEGR